MSTPGRVAALWVPDWPVLAAMVTEGVDPHVPAAVHDGRRVTAVSAAARALGVRRGMRRRHARETCPDLALLPVDDARDVRLFEPVVVAVEGVVAGVEVVRPGLLLLPSEGAGRYHGSEDALAERLVDAVGAVAYEAQVGVADGVGAAVLAARAARILPPGTGQAFLAPLGIGELQHVAAHGVVDEVPRLVDLLSRLGLRTLGDLARLPRTDVTARFGPLGTWAHQVASGEDDRTTALRRPEEDVAVEQVLDPPVERIEGTAFAARRLAEALHARLVERGAGCGRLQIVARTEDGDELVRTWRTDAALGGLAVARITDRVRWQLEGWLTRSGGRGRLATSFAEDPAPSALVHLALRAEEVVAVGAEQGRLWGDPSGGDRRAHRALHRVQGLLGADSVLGAVVQGGRDLRDQVHLVPWGEETPPARPADAPWPGRLPPPAPATVLVEPEAVRLVGADGRPVQVDARLELSVEPATLHRGRTALTVDAWAGPWPVVQRWWGPEPERTVYLQAVPDDGPALLLALRDGAWTVEARYD